MPSSAPDHLTELAQQLLKLQPETILDVGIGYGKLAFLAREYLEAWKDRVHPESWKVTIHGIEAWEPYTKLPWIHALYDEVWHQTLQDRCNFWERCGDPFPVYDLVVAGDVIEHLPKEEAVKCLKTLLKACKGHLLINLPLGEAWLNNQIVDGNPYEQHRSAWSVHDVYELGEVLSSKTFGSQAKPVGWFVLKGEWTEPAPQIVVPRIAPPAAPPPSNTILHVHNVRRCGGTGNFVYDLARCFPEFEHVALCVNDPSGDPRWIQAVSNTMRPIYAPALTPELLDELNPRVVCLHSTVGGKLGSGDPKADWPYDWLSDGGRRFVIAFHHTVTYPLVPADLDVFVSEFIKKRYEAFLPRMKAHAVIPPCTDLRPFAAITREHHSDGVGSEPLALTTAGKACDEAKAVLSSRNGASGPWIVDHQPPGTLGSMPGYLSKFPFAVVWSGHQETWCRTVSEAMAAGCLTFAHRAGAVPEQITHGQNGFLFDTGDELVKLLDEVRANEMFSPLRLQQIARAGREWALKNVGFERLKNDLYPHLMRGVLGSAV